MKANISTSDRDDMMIMMRMMIMLRMVLQREARGDDKLNDGLRCKLIVEFLVMIVDSKVWLTTCCLSDQGRAAGLIEEEMGPYKYPVNENFI